MKRILILLNLICVISFCVASQETGQTVRGTVVDAFTSTPIVGATIRMEGSNPEICTISNDKGEFTISNVQPGRESFTASTIGYGMQSVNNIMVISGKETILRFKLEEKITKLADVVVSNGKSKERPLNETALLSARSFSVEETERFAGSLGDPARMVSNFAGVVVSNDARNDIIIRGNSPSGLLWKIEGVDVPNPNHFGAQGSTGGPVSMLNSNLLANSDFLTGAFPAEYGNALSGVFDLNLRSGNKEKYEFTGQVGFNGFEAAAEGPIKLGKEVPKGSFLVDYRYSTMQMVGKLGMNAGTGTAIPEYNDLSVIVDLPTRKMGRFKYIGIYGNSFIRLNRSFNISEATTHSQVGFATDFGAKLGVSILTHTMMLSENTKLKSSLSYQQSSSTTLNDTIDYVNQTYFTNYAGTLAEKKEVLSTLLKHKFSAKDNLSAGLYVNRYNTTFHDSAYVRSLNKVITLSDVEKAASILYEGYINWHHKFTDNLTLNAGMHYQYYNLNQESALEPRLGLQWQFASNQSLSAGYGMHSQIQPRSVHFYKEYNHGVYTENNHDLKFTRSSQFVLGYDLHLGNDFRIKAEAYHQGLYKVPVSRVSNEFSMLNAGSGYYIQRLDSLENTGKGRNFGVEFTAEKFLSNSWYALTTISLYDSKYQGFDKKWRNTAFNSNFAVNALAGYEWKVGKKNYLTLDLRTVWSGGMRFIPIDLPASIASGEQVFDAQNTYSDKYKAYFRTDLRIGFKQNLGKISQEWGLDLQNVTNHSNLFSEQYNNQLQEVTQIFQQAFMPMMLYRINF